MTPLKVRVRGALKDNRLRDAVLKSCQHSVAARMRTVGELDDFQSDRLRAREARERSLDQLDPLLEQFTAQFTASGGKIHPASNGAEACRIIVGILKSHNARRGVKSKSMVSEEIELSVALKAAGIDAVESDLGEFIVQLAGEPPSHITAPALHRSRQSIGQLFSHKLGIPYTEDPNELTAFARRHLRERFLSAEFGMSGGNFLVAETGHIVVVENEGNARMGLSLPPLFIAITGIEKAIGTLEDLAALLRLLARSATGQRASSYVNLLRPSQGDEDGPKEMHLVLLDNGRRRLLADPAFKEMLLCIRCGACLNSCPVYQTVGGHAYGSVYPGPMGAILSNLLGEETEEHRELPHLSTLCGACREVCPVGIDLPRMLLELRARAPKPFKERMAARGWEWAMSRAPRMEAASKLMRIVGAILPGGLPGGWLESGERSFRDQVK